jgi:hypothetical protein
VLWLLRTTEGQGWKERSGTQALSEILADVPSSLKGTNEGAAGDEARKVRH